MLVRKLNLIPPTFEHGITTLTNLNEPYRALLPSFVKKVLPVHEVVSFEELELFIDGGDLGLRDNDILTISENGSS